ncbi:MAG: potassium transporter TrkA [Haloarculaceae archaeon]
MVTVSQVSELIAQLSGLAIFAGTLAAIAAFVYRWYVREEIPRGLALLVGLSGVAVYLNTTTALGQVIGGSSAPTEIEVALFNIVAFLAGAGGATLGHWAGDWSGTELFLDEKLADVESDVGRLVQSVGRVIAVELPTDIDDVVGYDPVPDETRETLAGKTFLFPRRLTVDELRDRLVTRLKADYGVGHVDIELAADGTVEYLALGSRAAGIGPTLPPATNAVAIRADPAFAASAGDLVQVWETDPMRRVLTAELRGVAEDTVTIAIDAADTQKIDPTTEYRLVTLPVEDRPDREFASLLRAADETFSSVTVEAGSPLHGLPIGALDLLVVAVKPDGEKPRALADPSTVLAPGDVVFAIARPDALRRLEVAANPLDPALVSDPSTQSQHSPQSDDGAATATPPAERQSTTDQSARPDAAGESEATSAADEAATTADEPETDSEETDESTDTDDEPRTADFDPPAAAASDESDESDDTTAGKAGGSSFQQLKDEFEAGDADWAEGEAANGGQSPEREDATSSGESAETADSTTDESEFSEGGLDDALAEAGADLAGPDSSEGAGDDSDELDVEEADDDLDGLSFGDEGDDGLTDDDTLDFEEENSGSGSDDLDSLSFDDDADDDLSSLSFDEGEDEGLSLDDEGDDEDEEVDDEGGDDEEDDSEEDGDDDDDDGGGGGGASSFQQLKEEFESGDADWEDDISDSPGGDMRLDE